MFKEPFGVYTNPADFGETVYIDGVPVRAVVDREYLPDAAQGFAVANADPLIIAADADLPENLKSAVITVRGEAYTVAETEFDGTGITVVQLRKKHEKPAY